MSAVAWADVAASAAALAPKLRNWRRHLHTIPEPAFGEFQTSAYLRSVIEELPVVLTTGAQAQDLSERYSLDADHVARAAALAQASGMDAVTLETLRQEGTGLVLSLGAGAGPTIGVRVDIDGLPVEEAQDGHKPAEEQFRSRQPGFMHACAHDGHMAIGLGLAAALAPVADTLPGRLKIIFQPAEEGTRGGARTMAAQADGLDYIVPLHIGLGVPSGSFVAGAVFMATAKYSVTFRGRNAHVTNSPQSGANALLAAAQASIALHALAPHSRGWFSLNVGTLRAGTEPGTVPDTAVLQVGIWADASEAFEYADKRLREVLQGCATSFGCEHSLKLIGRAPTAYPDADLMQACIAAARTAGFTKVSEQMPCRAGEDATELMLAVQKAGGRATYAIFGSDLAGGHHAPTFDFDEAVMAPAVACLCDLVRRLMEQGIAKDPMLEDPSVTPGQVLRQYRKDAKLTVRQLAEVAGVSPGHLSQIENGKTSGSLYTLRRIARAMNRPVAALFTDGAASGRDGNRDGEGSAPAPVLEPRQQRAETQETGVVRRARRKKLQMAENSFVYELLSPDLRGAIEFLWIEVEPGHPPTELMAHSSTGEECALVLQGTMWLIIGDTEHVLHAGDSIRFDPAVPHRIENRGTETLVQISAITPPSF